MKYELPTHSIHLLLLRLPGHILEPNVTPPVKNFAVPCLDNMLLPDKKRDQQSYPTIWLKYLL